MNDPAPPSPPDLQTIRRPELLRQPLLVRRTGRSARVLVSPLESLKGRGETTATAGQR